MLQILKYCFGFVAFVESGLILWDAGKTEVMLSEVLSLEDLRTMIVIGSLLCLATLDIATTNAPDS
jgi:hypothetical protein